jgi:hypothetical protein
MKGNFCFSIVLVLFVGSGTAIAQQTSPSVSTAQANLRFEEVMRGMAQQMVLDGLANKYHLQKIDLNSSELDMRAVYDQNGLAVGQIVFEKGKVSAVITNTLPPLTGDAVKLARELFGVLYFQAESPKAATDIDKFLGTRNVVLSATLDRTQTRNFDEQRIILDVGKMRYRIIINLPIQSSLPANVRMDTVR